MMYRAGMRRCRRGKALGADDFLLLPWEEVHHGTKGLGQGLCSAGELGLAGDQGKIGEGFGEPGERTLGTKAWCCCTGTCLFYFVTASWQGISCFDGKSSVLWDVRPQSMSHKKGLATES